MCVAAQVRVEALRLAMPAVLLVPLDLGLFLRPNLLSLLTSKNRREFRFVNCNSPHDKQKEMKIELSFDFL